MAWNLDKRPTVWLGTMERLSTTDMFGFEHLDISYLYGLACYFLSRELELRDWSKLSKGLATELQEL